MMQSVAYWLMASVSWGCFAIVVFMLTNLIMDKLGLAKKLAKSPWFIRLVQLSLMGLIDVFMYVDTLIVSIKKWV